MKRHEIINLLINNNGYKTYLEIGLDDGVNFSKIMVDDKVSVDPSKDEYSHATPTYKMTSDDFFTQNNKRYDIIFIDGLHHSDQVYKDIKNSLKYLNYNGTIVCHDMSPEEEGQQVVPRKQKVWTGDCWKAWVNIRKEQNNLKMYVVDCDWGVGVIQKSDTKDIFKTDLEINFQNLENNRNNWLNLISVEDFKKNINKK